jgi:hypothetical protein
MLTPFQWGHGTHLDGKRCSLGCEYSSCNSSSGSMSGSPSAPSTLACRGLKICSSRVCIACRSDVPCLSDSLESNKKPLMVWLHETELTTVRLSSHGTRGLVTTFKQQPRYRPLYWGIWMQTIQFHPPFQGLSSGFILQWFPISNSDDNIQCPPRIYYFYSFRFSPFFFCLFSISSPYVDEYFACLCLSLYDVSVANRCLNLRYNSLYCFYNDENLWRMVSSGMLHHVALIRTDVSEELSVSFIKVIRICEIGTTLAVTSNRRTLGRNTKS